MGLAVKYKGAIKHNGRQEKLSSMSFSSNVLNPTMEKSDEDDSLESLTAAQNKTAADYLSYWKAHPELQALVTHFMAKGKHEKR